MTSEYKELCSNSTINPCCCQKLCTLSSPFCSDH